MHICEIAVKYGTSQDYWCTTPVSNSYGVGLWKNISNSSTMFNKFVKFEVGTGNRIVFFRMFGGEEGEYFKDQFPELFHIARNKEARVADYMNISGSIIHWNLTFIGAIHDWELEVLDLFFDTFYSIHFSPHQEDRMVWRPCTVKGFKVSSFYRALCRGCDSSFP